MLKDELIDEEFVILNGYQGMKQEYLGSPGGTECKSLTAAYVVGDRLYTVGYMAKAGTYNEALAKRFVDSFEIK